MTCIFEYALSYLNTPIPRNPPPPATPQPPTRPLNPQRFLPHVGIRTKADLDCLNYFSFRETIIYLDKELQKLSHHEVKYTVYTKNTTTYKIEDFKIEEDYERIEEMRNHIEKFVSAIEYILKLVMLAYRDTIEVYPNYTQDCLNLDKAILEVKDSLDQLSAQCFFCSIDEQFHPRPTGIKTLNEIKNQLKAMEIGYQELLLKDTSIKKIYLIFGLRQEKDPFLA
ncbi:MAG: hypothetical protein LVR00_03780 [Rhabdochlamydiaceae bacterium]